MPFMDDNFMEDLFGDSEPVIAANMHMHASAVPLIKGVPQRLEELTTSGCCQKLAWSNCGLIASISQDTLSIHTQAFRRNQTTGEWGLSPRTALHVSTVEGEPLQFTHVSWHPMGGDLAAFDRFGRIILYSNIIYPGRVIPLHLHAKDLDHLNNAVIGMHWLPIFPTMARQNYVSYAERNNEQTPPEFKIGQYIVHSSSNRHDQRAAFLCLTESGTLRFFYQLHDSRWADVSQEITSAFSTNQIFSHASFAAENDRAFILSAHDESGSLHVYSVEVVWRTDEQDKQQHIPGLRVFNLFTELTFGPSMAGEMPGAGSLDLQYSLTHLEILPPTVPRGNAPSAPMVVLAAFAITPSTLAPTLDGMQHTHTDAASYTVLTCWELQRTSTSLSSCFDNFSTPTKTKSASAVQPRESKSLVRQASINMHSVVLSINSLRYDSLLAFVMGDGSIDFRERDALEISAHYAGDLNSTLKTLSAAGFAFPIQTSPTITLSPNYCMTACIDAKGKIKLSKMENVMGSSTPDYAPLSPIAITGLVIQLSSASTLTWATTDDICAVFPVDSSPAAVSEFLEQCWSAYPITPDFTIPYTNPQQGSMLISSQTHQRFWSAQSALCTSAKGERTVVGSLAWITLDMRAVARALFFAIQARKDATLPPQVADSIKQPITWAIELFVLIIDELSDLWMETKNILDNTDDLKAHLTANPPLFLLLILCSAPRQCIKMIVSQLSQVERLAQQSLSQLTAQAKGQNQGQYAHMIEFFSRFVSMDRVAPVRYRLMASLVDEVDAAVRRDIYDVSGYDKDQRSLVERRMFVRGEIPDLLLPAVQKLFKEILPRKLDEVDDMGVVRVRDVRWLGLTSDERTKEWQKKHLVDVVRRAEVVDGKKLKRCMRCGSATQELEREEVQRQMEWAKQAGKVCICGGNWYIESSEKETSGHANTH